MADRKVLIHEGMVRKAGKKEPPKSPAPQSDPRVDARARTTKPPKQGS